MKVHTGESAPEFALPDQHGRVHSLTEFRGTWTLLYFYPKDDTAGCTKEACSIRNEFPNFQELDAIVLGISADTVASHKKFADKYHLPFMLLADEEKKVIRQYGVWGRKKFMGREYDGILRMSFLIDRQGRVAKVYEQVKPEAHAAEVLEDLMALHDSR